MRNWTYKSDYTAVAYKGTVPRSVVLTEDGIELPVTHPDVDLFRTPVFSNNDLVTNIGDKKAFSMIRVSTLVKELEETAQNYRQETLPASTVTGMMRRAARSNLASFGDGTSADPKQWPDPPHVEFANCAFDSPEDLKRFVETYGFGLNMIFDPRLPFAPPKAPTINVERLKQDQKTLRDTWGKTKHARVFKDHFLWSPDDIDVINGRPRIITSDIWDYISALYMIDLSAGRLKVCHYPDCRQLKYFVKERRNQKFCSTTCKNAFNIKFWLANPENREHWNAGRRKRSKAKARAIRKK